MRIARRRDLGSRMIDRRYLLLPAAAICCAPAAASTHRPRSPSAIAAAIKADVAEMVGGINRKDIAAATKFDAPDLVSMESGREPSVGAKADHEPVAHR